MSIAHSANPPPLRVGGFVWVLDNPFSFPDTFSDEEAISDVKPSCPLAFYGDTVLEALPSSDPTEQNICNRLLSNGYQYIGESTFNEWNIKFV